jgi:hypothetical protein
LAAVVRLLVQRRRIFGLLIEGAALVVLWQELFDLPVMLFDADGELKVFASDGIPVLILDQLAQSQRKT